MIMKKKYFYIPLAVVGVLTMLAAAYVKTTDPTIHALRSALYVNLLASGITVCQATTFPNTAFSFFGRLANIFA